MFSLIVILFTLFLVRCSCFSSSADVDPLRKLLLYSTSFQAMINHEFEKKQIYISVHIVPLYAAWFVVHCSHYQHMDSASLKNNTHIVILTSCIAFALDILFVLNKLSSYD
jgi:hypothetical protein